MHAVWCSAILEINSNQPESHGTARMCKSEALTYINRSLKGHNMKIHFSLTQPSPYSMQWSTQGGLWEEKDMGGWEERASQSWGEGGVVEEDRRCMIKAYILKSLTSPLVWLMGPASQSDRGKGLEKWCNYCFLNRGLKRPAWKEDLEEILQGILDSRLPPLHPSTPPHLPHTLKPHTTTTV